MNQKSTTEVYTTNSYGKFKHFPGNRELNEKNVQKIIKSIGKIGWIPNPITVNSKLEVVDGQHRLEALKRLGMPVEYIMVENASADALREMNDKQFRWKANDFTLSYAEEGRTSYQFVAYLMNKYQVASYIVMRAANKQRRCSTWNSGDMIFTAEDYKTADEKLAQYKELEGAFAGHRKHGQAFITGIFFLIENGYDLQEIKKAELKNHDDSARFYNVRMFLEYIEQIYNYRKSADHRIYPMNDFKKTLNYAKHHNNYGG